MKYTLFITLLAILGWSCGAKRYVTSDYSFYSPHFRINSHATNLRTDGVYISQSVSANGQQKDSIIRQLFYKFYTTGQVNLTLDFGQKISTDQQYADAVRKDSSYHGRGTLFESYYRLQGDSIIIQSVNMPLRQFYYQYGFVKQDSLIIVKSTIKGRGRFKNSNFSGSYREVFTFKPIADLQNDHYTPYW